MATQGKTGEAQALKRQKVTPLEEAIERLRNLLERLSKRSEYLKNKFDAETKFALENRVKNERAALQAMRRRKRYKKQLRQMDGTTTSLEIQLESLTSAAVNVEVAKCLKLTSETKLRTFGNMSADLRDEVSGMMEDKEEFGGILAQPLGGEESDDDDLLAELDEMDQDDLTNKLSDMQFPSVPTEEVKVKVIHPDDQKLEKAKEEEQEKEELNELAEWMST